MKIIDFTDLNKAVIQSGLCTGCGTCVGVCPSGVIRFDFQKDAPILRGACSACGLCYSVCPGKDIPLAALEKKFLGQARTKNNEYFGVSLAFLKGYATDPEIRKMGASGGLATALTNFMIDQGLIDGAIVASMNTRKPWRTKPVLAANRTALIEAAQSKYAICPNNMVLKEARRMNRLAVVGLPCHVHGIRKVQSQKKLSELAQKIVCVLGIFCGSNRSYMATEHMIKEYTDLNLSEIKRFEYRGGIHSQDVKIYTRDHQEITITTEQRMKIFRNLMSDRCRMCCDAFAELADVSLGDIFDPQSGKKVPNWNSLIIRSEKGQKLIAAAEKSGVIHISPLEEAAFYGNSAFEMKKHGAVNNLKARKGYGWPVPDYHFEFSFYPIRKPFYQIPSE